MSGLDLIAFDADDTLWHNLIHFDATEKQFGHMLSHFAEPAEATRQLMEAEKRNIPLYGFGVKGFTLSMIETAIAVSGGAVDSTPPSRSSSPWAATCWTMTLNCCPMWKRH